MGFRRLCNRAIGLALLTCLSLWGQRPAAHGTSPSPASRTASVSTGYKGIFEPVNYPQDVNLTDVFFTGAEEGWVSGEHATILHTTDGGKTWMAQVGGDATSAEHPIHSLRFLDSKHGWAIKDDPARLLRTSDGQNWEEVQGSFPPGVYALDYVFTSVRHGVLLGSNNGGFYVTNDGGRHWQPVAPCRLSATVQGLARIEDCRVRKLQMLSARVGYALVDWSQGVAFLRTNDAGEHWQSIVPEVTDCCGPDVFFTDLKHGVLLFNNGKTYVTDNGGKNWRALLSGTVGLTSGGQTPPLRFSDPEVGWVVGASPDSGDTFRVSFSTDAGQHWKMSGNIKFPVERFADLKFSFPRRDRAYVIGPHGMIYRYRVVPKAYSPSNALDGPLMPGVDDPVLQARTQRVRDDIAVLQAKLSAAMARGGAGASSPISIASSPASSAPSGSDASASTSPGGDSSATVAMSSDTSGASAAASALELTSGTAATADANLTNGSNSTGASTSADSANATSDSASGVVAGATDTTPAPSFDNTAPSAPVTACCAAQVQTLQNDVGGLTQQLPTFAGKFRSLNMIVAGLQIFSDLLNKAQAMRETFRTLKHAPSLQAASAALMQLASNVQSTQQNITAELQNPGSVALPASDASTPVAAQAFAQPADTGAQPAVDSQPGATAQAGAAAAVPQSTAPAATPSSDSSSNSETVTQTADKAVDKAKDKVKKKLGGWIPH
jgi:photosystem II stability/assembly factor-like uncharacterized protein